MSSFFRSMSPKKLFASWVGYWVLLIAVGLGPAFAAIWQATRAGPDKGSFSLSMGSDGFALSVVKAGATIYSKSIHLLPLALLVAGPPLLLWVLWFANRSKRNTPDAAMRG
jgi:hypothetical protein